MRFLIYGFYCASFCPLHSGFQVCSLTSHNVRFFSLFRRFDPLRLLNWNGRGEFQFCGIPHSRACQEFPTNSDSGMGIPFTMNLNSRPPIFRTIHKRGWVGRGLWLADDMDMVCQNVSGTFLETIWRQGRVGMAGRGHFAT